MHVRVRLQVPTESYGGSRVHEPCTLFEEESEAIRNCSLLSSAVLGGLMKSFSTGDISHVLELDPPDPLRSTVSEELITENARNVTPWNNLEVGCTQRKRCKHLLLLFVINPPNLHNVSVWQVPVNRRLDCASRSCSTWVAVGDMHSAQSTSQLPSPSARCGSGNIPGTFAVMAKVTNWLFVRYILPSRAAEPKLELSARHAIHIKGPPPQEMLNSSSFSRWQSGLATIQFESAVAGPSYVRHAILAVLVRFRPCSCVSARIHVRFTAADLVRSVNKKARQMYIRRRLLSTYKALERLTKSQLNLSEALQATGPQDLRKNLQDELRLTSSTSVEAGRTDGRKTPLTTRDVERDRGKPLTKYERNMMIFNWLHNLDDDDDSVTPPFDLPPGSNGGSQQQVQQAA
ncbi:hypothetical protein BIW11_11008 [Tropilaelaps mercedesae]|uniref:Uncharacterized protein n=1 Tax=Tropilaelaps mercedesae TaxID=418985 RepID=A0A1V9XDB4_9ACAR|nr:hypothetical protein BIW11_11008 [Tropilaelaps mercedesae]